LRDLLLRVLVMFGASTVLLTEALSPFHLIRPFPLAAAWLAIGAGGAVYLYRGMPRFKRFAVRPAEGAISAASIAIVALVGLAAALSAPNSYDAMAYHLPRVVYWAQAGSVAFFPTSYFTQISLPPMAEYAMLQTYVLTGGDRLVNLVAAGAFAASIAGVSCLAGALGANSKVQALAAFCCATLPNAILQASGAKNDTPLALWLVCAAYFALRRNLFFLGLSFGLAVATKSTAYLYAPPLVASVLAIQWLQGRRPRWGAIALALAAGALLLNTPQYWRNLQFSGSPLGYDSPYGKGGPYRWANARFGWKPTVSNALRNLSDQLGDRSARWNQAEFDAVLRLHSALHIDPQDRDTTWAWAQFAPPVPTAHEGNANNRWHLLLMAAGMALALWWAVRRRDWVWFLYGSGLVLAFLLFSFYLKWEASGGRMLLPLFILASPLAGVLLAAIRPAPVTVLLCLFLLSGARLPLLKNWTRPLTGPLSVFHTPRDEQYYMDMLPLNDRPWQLQAVDATVRSACDSVGLDVRGDDAEYPFEALLRARNSAVRFQHVGVENASARYHPAEIPGPCAVLCMRCRGDAAKIAKYEGVGKPIEFERSLLFLKAKGGG
jgi:hypothetical protein